MVEGQVASHSRPFSIRALNHIPLARSARITKRKKNSHSRLSGNLRSVPILPDSGSGSPNDDVSGCQPFAQLYLRRLNEFDVRTLKGLKLGDLGIIVIDDTIPQHTKKKKTEGSRHALTYKNNDISFYN
jgi:hypothetical protein